VKLGEFEQFHRFFRSKTALVYVCFLSGLLKAVDLAQKTVLWKTVLNIS